MFKLQPNPTFRTKVGIVLPGQQKPAEIEVEFKFLSRSAAQAFFDGLRAQTEDRSIPASELTGYTISLSNFGMFAGRYASPVVVPPCVAIVGAGLGRSGVFIGRRLCVASAAGQQHGQQHAGQRPRKPDRA